MEHGGVGGLPCGGVHRSAPGNALLLHNRHPRHVEEDPLADHFEARSSKSLTSPFFTIIYPTLRSRPPLCGMPPG